MDLLRRPTPRFIIWGVLLVAVAVATGLAGLPWWQIILIELVAWAVLTIADRLLVGSAPLPAPADDDEAPAPPEEAAVAEEAAPAEEPAAAPVRRRVIPTPARSRTAPAPAPDPVRWNVWSLERIARDTPNAEELEFLVTSLRDFADADGQLPADFDSLVRESFGDLLVG